jgi:hypothetical protein
VKLASKFRAFAARCKQELVIQIITDVHSGAKGCHDQIPIPDALPVRAATALSLSPRLLRSGALLIFTRKYCPWPPSFATSIRACIAVWHSGAVCSAFGSLVM